MTTATAPALRKTALNATHRAHKAKMVDFGGWDMPVEYSGLVAEHMAVRTGVGLFDVSHMGDIQFRGPGSLAELTDTDLRGIKNYWFTWGKVCGLYNVMIARTGYTGEDGFEIYIPSDEPTSGRVWGELLEAGAEFGILPCGLGARNTLRLESAMALYGHEISDTINVLEAGLGRYAKLDKPAFVGMQTLLEIQASGGPKRKLIGLEMIERGIGRDGYPIFTLDGVQIGEITSGSPAPFLKKNIALAYAPVEFAALGTEVGVEIRGQKVKAKVVPTPFYKR